MAFLKLGVFYLTYGFAEGLKSPKILTVWWSESSTQRGADYSYDKFSS